jgi:WD40 repeat protein
VELVRPGGENVLLNLTDSPVRATASSPDGSLLLIGDMEGNVILFRTVRPSVPRSVAARGSRISDIRFLDSGNSLAVCRDQQAIDVRDVVSGDLLWTIPTTTKSITDVEMDAETTTLYYCLADGTLGSWNVQRQEPGAFEAISDQRIVDSAISADGRKLFGISKGGLLTVFQLESNQRELQPTGHEANCSALVLSRRSTRVFTADDSGTIKCWDRKSLSELHSTSAGMARIHELAIDPGDEFLAAAFDDGLVRVLDSETLVPVAELIVHTSAVRSLDFSPDGKILATGGMDSRVILWDTGLWQTQATWGVDGTGIRSVRFSPDGNRLAVAGNHDQVMIWEVEP